MLTIPRVYSKYEYGSTPRARTAFCFVRAAILLDGALSFLFLDALDDLADLVD